MLDVRGSWPLPLSDLGGSMHLFAQIPSLTRFESSGNSDWAIADFPDRSPGRAIPLGRRH
ncbi:MAG: hypothetical protein CL933_17060 [Deltaproteobacteria bacterium]|nr:hypothetical protein [Deltaproteobacteria bacterium]